MIMVIVALYEEVDSKVCNSVYYTDNGETSNTK